MTTESPLHSSEPAALVVGCGGMGMSVARALGKHHPLVLVDIDAKKLDDAVSSLRLEGYVVSGHTCDITDRADIAKLQEALSQGPGLSAWAQVAAVAKAIGDWRKMIDIDLIGACYVAEAVGPQMVPGSAAVLISSLASYLPPSDSRIDALFEDPLQAGFLEELAEAHGEDPDLDWAYNYAKLGINKLAERLAVAWGPNGVRVNSLSPGMIDSPMARSQGDTLPVHDGSGMRVTRSEKAKEVPLGREGRLPEISSVVEFLVSDGASFLSGIDITVDGGHRARWRANGTISR